GRVKGFKSSETSAVLIRQIPRFLRTPKYSRGQQHDHLAAIAPLRATAEQRADHRNPAEARYAGRPTADRIADQARQHHRFAAAYRRLRPQLAGIDPDVAVDVGLAPRRADLLDDVQEHH